MTEARPRLEIEGINDAILSSIPNGILVMDVGSKALYVNRAGERIFGCAAADLVGQQLIFHKRFRPLIAVINEHRKTVPPLEISHKQTELELARPDGSTILLDLAVASLAGEDRQVLGFVIVCSDLSEIQMLRDRAQRAEALAALGTIAAGVAHEVRNPLHAIRGAAELIELKVGAQSDVAQYLEVIAQETVRADRIIEEVLDYSRAPRMEMVPIDVNRAVRDYLPLLEIPDGIRVVLDFMEGLPRVVADEFKLKQVLANLINNAKDSMKGQGTMSLATSLDPGPSEVEALGVGYVRIDISDTGPGIAPERLPHLFDLKFHTSKKQGGTGLGLSICMKIVESHQGFLKVRSSPGQGATFSVYLPVKEG
jgi:PAS domain S-box-containing protein